MIHLNQTYEFLEALVDAILIVDQDTNIVFANPSCAHLFGYKNSSMTQLSLKHLMATPLTEEHHQYLNDFILNKRTGRALKSRNTIPCIKENGDCFTAKISLSSVKFDDHHYVLAIIQDFSSIQAIIDELKCRSETDSLTGLFNIRHLNQVLEQRSQIPLNSSCLGVAYLDLNNFKQLNDRYGHDVGNRVLVEIAKRLSDELRSNDTCFRVGGDEFLVLFDITNHNNHKNEVNGMANTLRKLITRPVYIEKLDHDVSTEVSIGIGAYPYDGKNLSELIEKVDQAMYRSKKLKSPFISISEFAS